MKPTFNLLDLAISWEVYGLYFLLIAVPIAALVALVVIFVRRKKKNQQNKM